MEILKTLEKQVDPFHTALLIVDVQKDFCSEDGAMASLFGADVSRIYKIMPILNEFIEEARRHHVFVVWLKEECVPDQVSPNYKAIHGDASELNVVIKGSDGAGFFDQVVRPLDNEPIVIKENYDGFEGTDLHAILQSRGIKTLLMTGFTTNVCVETTARHGYLKGYYIVMVSDCSSAYDSVEHESSLLNIRRYFGKVATSDEISAIWAKNH